jgi:predicted nucleic acid-binding protein
LALILDTGPLYASLDRRDSAHERSRLLIETTTEVRIIPSPVLVEVDYWIQRYLRPSTLVSLLRDVVAGAYLVEDLLPEDYARAADLTERYADSDIGFVDAAVLAIVERLGESKLATLDRRHFSLLRPRHVDALQLLPD